MAGSSPENISTIKQRFDDVCSELNMDEATAVSAWETYEKINRNYTLEVSQHLLIVFCGHNIRKYVCI